MATSTVAGSSNMSLLLRGLASALAVTSATALRLFPVENMPDWQSPSAMTIQMTAPGGGVALTYEIAPFTASVGLNVSAQERGAINIRGNVVVATETSYVGITSHDAIAYLCCDNMNNSFITPEMMLTKLMDNKPKAILLYSQEGNCCGLEGDNSQYPSIFTMTDAESAASALNLTNSANGIIQASISGNDTNTDTESVANQSGNNSAVAMSILYSITGLITLLFLIIIATGAIRAHRYPERYGPRSGYGGRPRQSRAKGIARAMLDTLPIVKFGAPPAQKPDPDLELDDHPGDRRRDASDPVQVHHLSTIPEDAEAVSHGANEAVTKQSPMKAEAQQESAIGSESHGAEAEEHLGCSICTEDFTVGEDVRVLPCNHKFHPPCIDPWLINVSGTCPLCRLDLRPQRSNMIGGEGSSADGPDNIPLPPPLEADTEHDVGATPDGRSANNRRSSRFFDLNRLRHASVEERIEVLRRYRSESRQTVGAGGAEDLSRTSRLTHRLKDTFRIRTRAQSPPQHRPAARSGSSGGQIS